MNQNITVQIAGFKIEGKLISSRVSFSFAVSEVTEISTGLKFENLDAVHAELFFADSDESVARKAAIEAGIPYDILLDLTFEPTA